MTLTPRTPLEKYDALIAEGALAGDAAQREVALRLTALHDALKKQCGGWRRLCFWRRRGAVPRGLYIYGDVGRGKSMLMDLFFATAPVAAKRRVHFHAFMQETHERIFAYRQKKKRGAKNHDPIAPIAKQIAARAKLLCFDEFQVKDIADASLLGRLFTALFAQGVVVVATSNHAPDGLYKGGLNRARFLPFIDLLCDKLDVLLLDSPKDYRLDRLKNRPVWATPLGAAARAFMDEAFAALTDKAAGQKAQLKIKGRVLPVPCQAQGVARFSFAEICGADLGAGDYLLLAQTYHTLMIDDIPTLGAEKRNEALRFVHLVDALYEHKVKLLASAASTADGLCAENLAGVDFARTASRLTEMQGQDYMALSHIGPHIKA